MKSLITTVCILLTALFATSAFAEDAPANLSGLDIANELKRRDTGWQDSSASMVMTLRSASGDESVRKMRVQILEIVDDGDKSLVVFDEPRDVKGSALLSFSHTLTADEQWLYLPALKRVKTISSRNKSGPFMGSEFSYEDMNSFEVEKYRYTRQADELINGEPHFVVDQEPVDDYSGYTRQRVWIDQAHYRVSKIEFYDRKSSLLKVLTLSDYRQYLDKFWRAHKLTMDNQQTGRSTELLVSDLEFASGLREIDFNQNSLKRAR